MNNRDFNSFGHRLTGVLKALGITMKEMSEALGVPVLYISELCTGKKATPGRSFLMNLSKAYRVSLDYLLLGEGEMFLPLKKS